MLASESGLTNVLDYWDWFEKCRNPEVGGLVSPAQRAPALEWTTQLAARGACERLGLLRRKNPQHTLELKQRQLLPLLALLLRSCMSQRSRAAWPAGAAGGPLPRSSHR